MNWRPALVAAFVVVACAGCGTGGGEDSTVARATRVSAITTTTSGVKLASLPLAAADDTLPKPQHSPNEPYDDVPVREIGTIRIPRIGLTHPIYEGIWLTVIDHGPGHWQGSALPGEHGNTVFPGHRVTHSRPFLDLDRLERGDEIIFEMPYGRATYRATDTLIVTPADSYVVNQHDAFEVTLIACHPKHSAAQRIVVRGKLSNFAPTADALTDAATVAAAAQQVAS